MVKKQKTGRGRGLIIAGSGAIILFGSVALTAWRPHTRLPGFTVSFTIPHCSPYLYYIDLGGGSHSDSNSSEE